MKLLNDLEVMGLLAEDNPRPHVKGKGSVYYWNYKCGCFLILNVINEDKEEIFPCKEHENIIIKLNKLEMV